VRRVKTASGATAVQIVEKRNGRRRVLEHVGSAHDETELAVLVSAAQQRLYGIQDDMLQFEPIGTRWGRWWSTRPVSCCGVC
jgi:hypothetical protein